MFVNSKNKQKASVSPPVSLDYSCAQVLRVLDIDQDLDRIESGTDQDLVSF